MKYTFTLLLCIFAAILFSQSHAASALQVIIKQDSAYLETEFSSPGHPFPSISPEDEKRRADFYRQELTVKYKKKLVTA